MGRLREFLLGGMRPRTVIRMTVAASIPEVAAVSIVGPCASAGLLFLNGTVVSPS